MEENVMGKHLCQLGTNDLHRFGILEYDHKLQLLECIQQLLNKPKDNASENDE